MDPYRDNSDFWKRDTPLIQSDFLCRPHMARIAGDLSDKCVADLGCGEGYLSRLLLESNPGLTSIRGIDISTEMLGHIPDHEKMDFFVGDVCAASQHFKRGSIDVAFSSLVYVGLSPSQMARANEEAFSLLKDGGRFLVGLPHPMIYIKDLKTQWISYPVSNDYYRKSFPITLRSGDGRSFGPFLQTNYTVSEYVRSGLSAGFQLADIYEPLATEEDMNNFPKMWGLEDTIPAYLILVFEK